MTIAKYINDLLYRYDCVIVPNFGGFITNRIGAKVNPFTNNFYPPTKQIKKEAKMKNYSQAWIALEMSCSRLDA